MTTPPVILLEAGRAEVGAGGGRPRAQYADGPSAPLVRTRWRRRSRAESMGPMISRVDLAEIWVRPPGAYGVIRAQLETYRRDPRRAIDESGVVCLECGRRLRHLTNTHLQRHGLTSDEYKRRYGYNARRPLMSPDLRRTHVENAVRLGLALRIRRRPIVEDPALRRRGGQHPHAWEEILTRRERGRRRPERLARDARGRFSAPQSNGHCSTGG